MRRILLNRAFDKITCLLWFGDINSIKTISGPPRPVTPTAASTGMPTPWPTAMEGNRGWKDLATVGRPSISFRQWLLAILRTARLAENVVLLALLLIFRLKTMCPYIKGNPGSEYRLLTVALMLSNKCEFTDKGAMRRVTRVCGWLG